MVSSFETIAEKTVKRTDKKTIKTTDKKTAEKITVNS